MESFVLVTWDTIPTRDNFFFVIVFSLFVICNTEGVGGWKARLEPSYCENVFGISNFYWFIGLLKVRTILPQTRESHHTHLDICFEGYACIIYCRVSASPLLHSKKIQGYKLSGQTSQSLHVRQTAWFCLFLPWSQKKQRNMQARFHFQSSWYKF